MNFNIDFSNINKKAAEKSADEELQKERQIRTGMSMQQVATLALSKSLVPPQQQAVNPIQPPKNA